MDSQADKWRQLVFYIMINAEGNTRNEQWEENGGEREVIPVMFLVTGWQGVLDVSVLLLYWLRVRSCHPCTLQQDVRRPSAALQELTADGQGRAGNSCLTYDTWLNQVLPNHRMSPSHCLVLLCQVKYQHKGSQPSTLVPFGPPMPGSLRSGCMVDLPQSPILALLHYTCICMHTYIHTYRYMFIYYENATKKMLKIYEN